MGLVAGELFAGVGGFGLGCWRAGIETAWAVENDGQAQAVYRRHFPGVRLLGDVREIEPKTLGEVDVVTAGWPCQDLSSAGKQAGLKGERSGLFFEIIRLVKGLRPRWVFLENVPRLLTINERRDFGTVLSELGKCGYNLSGRVFNSRYFRVAQRRRRVFVVGHIGGFGAGEVLFESKSVRGDFKPRGEAGPEVAYPVKTNTGNSSSGGDGGINQTLIVTHPLSTAHSVTEDGRGRGVPIVAAPLMGREGKGPLPDRAMGTVVVNSLTGSDGGADVDEAQAGLLIAHTLTGEGFDASEDGSGRGTPLIWQDRQQSGEVRVYPEGVAPAVSRHAGTGGGNVPMVGVRRLTPLECERVQGFPDDWTRWGIDEDGNEIEISDSARYRLVGNAVPVPVVEWIARRLAAVAAAGRAAETAGEQKIVAADASTG